jgi:hypothetical protein
MTLTRAVQHLAVHRCCPTMVHSTPKHTPHLVDVYACAAWSALLSTACCDVADPVVAWCCLCRLMFNATGAFRCFFTNTCADTEGGEGALFTAEFHLASKPIMVVAI